MSLDESILYRLAYGLAAGLAEEMTRLGFDDNFGVRDLRRGPRPWGGGEMTGRP